MQKSLLKNRSQNTYRALEKFFLCFCISSFLFGCHKNQKNIEVMPRTLPYRVENSSDPTIIYLQRKLEKQHVRIITIGQDYLVSIPSYLLFPDESPQLNWAAYQLLNDVACYLQKFRMVAINITGYGVKYISNDREKALTLARAKSVANYLWSQGIDSRFVFMEGLGSDKPIIRSDKQVDTSPNSRIEITFRHTVA